ncbi:NIF3-like protein 1 [Halotydeus destructor]|nr:NIF3-like protein 1 [Halotydeus destructor]
MMESPTDLVHISVSDANVEPVDEEMSDEDDDEQSGFGGDSMNSSKLNKNPYRQKYKRTWEMDLELKEWLAPFVGDPFAAYCRTCHCKLHAHKKGLLAHAKSVKHKKHTTVDESIIGGVIVEEKQKKVKKSTFNDHWIDDPLFSHWLKKIPNNLTKAFCVACRSVLNAGRSELVKHSQAAKHKKAIADGITDEPSDINLEWLDTNYVPPTVVSSTGITLPIVDFSGSQNNPPNMDGGDDGMILQDVVNQLNELVPLQLAEGWDNVGLLVEPSEPHRVRNIFLTIDLTEKVFEEAVKKKANMIISYHPPIFRPLKSLTQRSWKEKLMVQCIESRIAVYSPHTALDAVKGGINDWLISAYGHLQSQVITQSCDSKGSGHFSNCLEVLVSEGEDITTALSSVENVIMTVKSNDYGCDIRICCDDKTVPKVVEVLSQYPVAQLCTRITKLQSPPLPGVGMGRLGTLLEPTTIADVINKTKSHLQLSHVRLALSPSHNNETKINTIAVCAGSGASVLSGVKADIYVTGEMSHHEVLDAQHKGTTVILCEHTNTERGYLSNWVDQQLRSVFADRVQLLVSEVDSDPLKTV